MAYSFTNPWLPTGFTYWEQGNWQSTGTNTSMPAPVPAAGTEDYLANALPKSGKWYWETNLYDLNSAQVFGISVGASSAGAGYTDAIFGYYYNGPIPLFLTSDASGTFGDAVDHGTSTGTQWAEGKKLMWAYVPGDAPNTGKIWLGYDGTWYGSGDPAAGTNPSISGADLSPANSGTNYYLKIGYSDGGGPIVLENVSGTSTPHLLTSVADMKIDATAFQQTTATAYITPTFSSVARVTSPEINKAHVLEFPPTKAALLHKGKRPSYGLQYPRGYYNK